MGRRTVAATLLAMAAWGCPQAPPPVPQAPPPRPFRAPEECLRVLESREASISTARGRIKLSVDGSDMPRTGEVDALLLVAKPDRVRLRAVGFLGLTLFDLVLDGGEMAILIPSRKVLLRGQPDTRRGAALLPGFLSLTGGPGPDETAGSRASDRDGEILVTSRRKLGVETTGDGGSTLVERRIVVDASTALPRGAEILLDGEPWATVTYSDFVEADGIPIPMRIEARMAREDISTRVLILEIALNEPVPEGAFRLGDLSGWEVKPFDTDSAADSGLPFPAPPRDPDEKEPTP